MSISLSELELGLRTQIEAFRAEKKQERKEAAELWDKIKAAKNSHIVSYKRKRVINQPS